MLERALTRAAVDEDAGASDKAEVVLSQKLESLFHKGRIQASLYVHD